MNNNFSKIILAVFVSCLFSTPLFSQGLYFNANSGIAFGVSNSSISNTNETTASYSHDYVAFSFGKGVNFGGTLGYMFNENFGADLGLSYLIGGETEGTNTSIDNVSKDTYSSKMFRINPSFIISTKVSKFSPYAKMGLIFGYGSFIRENTVKYNNGNESITNYKWDGDVAIGFTSAIGSVYKLSDNVSIYGELNLISLSYAPSKEVITKATNNGIDVLKDMSVYDKETDFVDNYTVDKTSRIDYTKPNKILKVNFPFSSFGFNLGFRFAL